jgi:hypothetical protein
VSATPTMGLPTLSQVREWQTAHLGSAAQRWTATAGKWAAVYAEVAAELPAPAGTAWEGDASSAAQARANRDRDGVDSIAERLRTAGRIAATGAQYIEDAQQEALMAIRMAGTMGFEVREDLSVVDRNEGLPGPTAMLRQQQAKLLAAAVRAGAAQLAAVDHIVASEINRYTTGFDALDFKRSPIIEPLSTEQDDQSFGECFSENFKEDIGKNMVQGVFVGGLLGAARGAIVGILGGPMGILGGGVLGFVGGAAGGALISGPLRTAATSALDCL